jgi:hypothetical protein
MARKSLEAFWKSVEIELQSQLLPQVELAVATFAGAGPLEWRKLKAKPASDVELFLSLPSVQQQLASFDGDLQADVNAAADAIEAAIRLAIEKRLSSPYLDAALEHFGFIAHPELGQTPLNRGDREEQAALKLGRTTKRWYTTPNKEYDGLKPRDYVVALVTCALCGVPNPMTSVGRRETGIAPPMSSDQPSSVASGRNSRTWVRPALLLAGSTILIAGVVAGLIATGFPGSESTPDERALTQAIQDGSIPTPIGWAVDAQTGEPVSPASLPKQLGRDGGQLGGGDVFWSCVNASTPCRIPKRGQPTYASAGDRLLMRLRLHDPSSEALAKVRVWISIRTGGDSTALTANMEWPTTTPNRFGSTSATTTVRFRDGKPHGLAYVPRSAMLYDSSQEAGPEGRLIARLPEGLMSYGGIILTDVGPPRGCWDCDLAYVRYVVFNMRVT